MHSLIPIVVRVIEHDLAPSLFVYFYIVVLGQFYVFAAVFAYFLLVTGGGLVAAYKMDNTQMIKVLRGLLVLYTFAGFLNIFVDSMTFTDVDNDTLRYFAYP